MSEESETLIRTLRQVLGMTQEEFAHEVGVAVSSVNRWGKAHSEPNRLAWKAIRELALSRGLTEVEMAPAPASQ